MNSPAPRTQRVDLMRHVRTWWDIQPVIVPLLAVLLSFVVGGVLIAIVGVNPFDAYWALLRGMFGSGTRVAGSLAKSVPYIGSALALAFAMRAGLFNIGAEGQLLVGGLAAAWAGTWAFMYDVPSIVAVPIIVLAGFIGGAAWGSVPGVLRAKTGAHEVITTIMLNWIALFGSRWIAESRDPVVLLDAGASVPRTKPISTTAYLPRFVSSNPPLHAGIFVLVIAAIVVWWVLRRTTFGFSTITTGTNPNAAHYAGINVNRMMIMAMVIAGGCAGLSGASEVAGTNHFFQPGTFAGMGFDGIAIAMLARANPLAIIPSAFLWGALRAGAPLMQQEAGVSIDVVRIIQAMVLLFVAADAIVRWVFRVRSERATGGAPEVATSGLGSA
ncbi:ABC transporter permease [Desertimonas flava]|uniref:ABC transporter permease n=1 Tax=Desertimonas flava TaxID=2064846 RepID=UPI000E35632B|nr:ABC transporter permease [Desertimonas flava]